MKNNMDYFKTMNEKDLDLTKTAVDWTDKAFRGNGDCAAIAIKTGKTCKVVPVVLATVTAQRLQEQRVKLVKLYCAMAKTRRFLKVSI